MCALSRTRPSLACLTVLVLLGACHAAHPPSATESTKTVDDGRGPIKDAGKDADEEGNDKGKASVTLTVEQVSKLGVAVEPATALMHRDEAIGYGLVMSHDAIAQAAAELISAQASERLSHSALARVQKLQGTPGAVSADVWETAAQKAEVDAALLTATEQKLSSLFGTNPPWKKGDAGGTVQALADGRVKLLRATFPLGALADGEPTSLRAARIGAPTPGLGWPTSAVWDAPADSALPGRSFFALFNTHDIREGERVQVFAPVGETQAGVIVPAVAVILSEGKYWCYVQTEPGAFNRVQVDTSAPIATGYFVKQGIAAGDRIVTNAAGLLLAKEMGGAAEPD